MKKVGWNDDSSKRDIEAFREKVDKLPAKRILEIGATYRHWKAGRLYKVLGEVEIKNRYQNGMAIRLKEFGVAILSTTILPGDIAVVYEDEAGHKFAREKESFLEILGDEQEGTMYYRFEKVGCPTSP